MQDLYFFEVIWEVACLRDGQWKTGKHIVRSAVRIFSDSLYRFGPDLSEVEDSCACPDLEELVGEATRNERTDRPEARGRKIPGAPRVMVASHGRQISPKQMLYELWEDSGLQALTADLFFIEPLIFCHAFKALLSALQEKNPPGAPADLGTLDVLATRAQLCVKKKTQRVETVLTSEAGITGRKGRTFGMTLYGALRHASVPGQKVRYSLLVPAEADFPGKPVSAGQPAADLPLRAGSGGPPVMNIRAPGDSGGDYVVLPLKPGEEKLEEPAAPALASSFLAYMNFTAEPSGLLWIF